MYEVAKNMYDGNSISAADKILGDFRKGLLGHCSLEAPPVVLKRQSRTQDKPTKLAQDGSVSSEAGQAAAGAIETSDDGKSSAGTNGLDIGKGNYDGW